MIADAAFAVAVEFDRGAWERCDADGVYRGRARFAVVSFRSRTFGIAFLGRHDELFFVGGKVVHKLPCGDFFFAHGDDLRLLHCFVEMDVAFRCD